MGSAGLLSIEDFLIVFHDNLMGFIIREDMFSPSGEARHDDLTNLYVAVSDERTDGKRKWEKRCAKI